LTGCSQKVKGTQLLNDPSLNIVWPPPPEQPRIKLLKVFRGAGEFVAKKSRMQSMFDSITGERELPVELMAPAGIVSDGDRYIYVADPSARLVHKFDILENEVTYLTHSGNEPLASPVGVALDSYSDCYVTDSVKAKVYKYNSKGEYVGSLGEGEVEFQRPAGIAIGRNDFKYVVDVLANKVVVFNQKDKYVKDFPSIGSQVLNRPVNVAVDNNNNIYITDAFSFSVKIFDNNGNLLNSIGRIGDTPGSFARPKGVAVDSESHIYIIDANFDNFQVFDQLGQLLLYVGSTGKKPGQFFMPNGIFVDQEDRIYVSDSYNQRIQIFQYIKEQAKK
jgi:sugar lactone lactonase YvrE